MVKMAGQELIMFGDGVYDCFLVTNLKGVLDCVKKLVELVRLPQGLCKEDAFNDPSQEGVLAMIFAFLRFRQYHVYISAEMNYTNLMRSVRKNASNKFYQYLSLS